MSTGSSAGIGLAEILSLALGSGVVSAVVSQVLSAWNTGRQVRREAAYTAVRSAIALEAYAEQAARTMNDWFHVNEMRVEHEREQGFEPDRASFPTFEGFADSLDWRHVDGKLSARALTFANEIRMAGDSISAAFDFDTDDGLEEMRLQAGRQGT